MFMPIKFSTSVQLTPQELTSKYENTIMEKLCKNLENVCSKHGYIKKNSIKIIKRSVGYFKEHHFNGNLAFDLCCIAEICNPAQDSIVKCVVKAKNTLGLLAEGSYDNYVILEVTVPKISYMLQSEIDLDDIHIGDEINVQVCGKKFMLYDNKISIVGKVIKDKTENVITVQEQDIDDIQVEEDVEPDDILVDNIELDGDENDYDDDDDENVKKIDIDDNDSKIGGKILDDDVEYEDEDEEDDEEEDDDEYDDIEDVDEYDVDDDAGIEEYNQLE